MMGPFYHAVNMPNKAMSCDIHRNLGNDYIKKKKNCGSFWSFVNLMHYAAAAAKSLQSCTTLCDPIDGIINIYKEIRVL